MKNWSEIFCAVRPFTMAIFVAATPVLLTACSTDFSSVDDVYVPASVGENYPIKVQDRDSKLTVRVESTGLSASALDEVASFAEGASSAKAQISISYPASSGAAQKGARQAADILRRGGVNQHAVKFNSYAGKSDVVVLSYTARVATTKPCGAWSENLRPNMRNEPMPGLGCAMQQNYAAMVANPGDFEHPRATTPVMSAPQNPAIEEYQSGDWSAVSGSGSSN